MFPELGLLLQKWKNVEIAFGLLKLVRKALESRASARKAIELEGPGALKDHFFQEKIYLGHTVRTRGRLSQYCPVYFPVAYSPQAQFGDAAKNIWQAGFNPAPTAMDVRSSSGSTLAFLFEAEATHTPRIVSPYHPDRTGPIPFHLADPAVPVLVDGPAARFLEQIVEVEGVLVRLDPSVSEVIDESDEEVVKRYYHAFYQPDFYPNKGYLIDARTGASGRVTPVSEVAPFATSVAAEVSYSTKLSASEVEQLLSASLASVTDSPGPARYRPAYYSPPGYEIIQLSGGYILVHLAPEMGVINVSSVIETPHPDRAFISDTYMPATEQIIGTLSEHDPTCSFHVLFASDKAFARRLAKRLGKI